MLHVFLSIGTPSLRSYDISDSLLDNPSSSLNHSPTPHNISISNPHPSSNNLPTDRFVMNDKVLGHIYILLFVPCLLIHLGFSFYRALPATGLLECLVMGVNGGITGFLIYICFDLLCMFLCLWLAQHAWEEFGLKSELLMNVVADVVIIVCLSYNTDGHIFLMIFKASVVCVLNALN